MFQLDQDNILYASFGWYLCSKLLPTKILPFLSREYTESKVIYVVMLEFS